MLRFHSNSYVFSKSKHSIIHEKFHSFTKGSIALLIESLRENKFLHLKFDQIKEVVSIQVWLLLRKNKVSHTPSFWKSDSKKQNTQVSSEKRTHRIPCIACFLQSVINSLQLSIKERLV